MNLFAPLGATPRQAFLEWVFKSGMTLKFAHLENEDTVFSYQGAQIPLIMFDELTHFEESQFWYLLSRLRSDSGVKGYIRATTNPDPDSFVRNLIDWWIGEDGYPIKERSGRIRWFIKLNDDVIWANTKEELINQYGFDQMPKSLTFIPSLVYDNKIMLEKDPSYLSNLMALNRVDRLRLLGGNWNVRASAGTMFRKEWFPVVEAIPSGWIQTVRYWDRAATKPNEINKDPDWTRGLKMYKYPDGSFLVADLKSIRDTPAGVESLVKNTASHDGRNTPIVGEQDPGSAGVADAENFVRMLSGYIVNVRKPTQNKIVRAKPVSAQAEVGNIKVLRASWNDEFFKELENFGEDNTGHDDIVDTLSGAFNEMSGGESILSVLGNFGAAIRG